MRIRTIDSPDAPLQGFVQNEEANPASFGGQSARALSNAGQAVDQTADIAQTLVNQKADLWRANAVSQAQLGGLQQMQQMQTDPDFAKKYGPDGGKFVDSFKENFQQTVDQVVAAAPTTSAGERAAKQLIEVRDSLAAHAISFSAQTAGTYAKTMLDQSMQADAKLVSMSPGDMDTVANRGKQTIAEAPYLTPDQRMELGKNYEQNLALAAGKGAVLHAPEAVLSAFAPDQLSMFRPTARVIANTKNPVTAFNAPAPAAIAPVAKYAAPTQQYATKFGVDANFMAAQQMAESGGNPAARNESDVAVTGHASVGLTQFQPATAARYGINPAIPEQAIKGQAAYMSDLLTMFNGDYRKAAAGYNWGEGHVQKAVAQWGDQWADHIPGSTQGYLNKIFNIAAPTGTADATQAAAQDMQTSSPVTGDNLPGWFNKLNWEQQFGIIKEAEQGARANQVRDLQQLEFQEKIKKAQQQETMNGFYDKLLDGSLTPDLVRNSNLDYQGKEHMIEAINKGVRGEAKTDPTVFNDLFNRIHADPSDPNRITDDTQLNAYMGKGLGFDDLNKLRGEIAGRHTADGSTLGDMKKDFFATSKGILDSSTMMKTDPTGKQNAYNFQQLALSYIAAQKKAGVSEFDLYDPNNKAYVGKLLDSYMRSPLKQMTDYSAYIRSQMAQDQAAKNGATPPGRQPGESTADYLKRRAVSSSSGGGR